MEQMQTVEKVQEQEQTAEVFENDITMHLQMFCEFNNIKDIKKESQSVWNGALRFIRKNVFSNKSILKSKSNINIYNNNIPSNFNAYNYEIVNSVCDIYIDLCFIYDKEVSIIGFSNLTGIDTEVIYDWGRDDGRKLSSLSSEIYKKLNQYREESLSNKLVTGKQNPVGVLGVLNRHYQWNMPGVREYTSKKVLSNNDLPILESKPDHSSNCTKDLIEQTFEEPPQS